MDLFITIALIARETTKIGCVATASFRESNSSTGMWPMCSDGPGGRSWTTYATMEPGFANSTADEEGSGIWRSSPVEWCNG